MTAELVHPEQLPRPAAAGNFSLSRLSDYDFQTLVVKQAFKGGTRDDDVWERLLSPGLVGRTREALVSAVGVHTAAMRNRRSEWQRLQASSRMPRAEYFAARSAYEERRSRDAHFITAMHAAIRECNRELGRINRELHGQQRQQDDERDRIALAELVHAVEQHHTMSQSTGTPPSLADNHLWSVLDRMTAVIGDGTVIPLRTNGISSTAKARA